jgi:hypothetical protein
MYIQQDRHTDVLVKHSRHMCTSQNSSNLQSSLSFGILLTSFHIISMLYNKTRGSIRGFLVDT